MRDSRPLIWRSAVGYPETSPFHPACRYPEFQGRPPYPSGDNLLFDEVRNLFLFLGLDRENAGSPDWNPLGAWIQPGMTVVLKPNWVKHETGVLCGQNVLCTHPSLIRVMADYALLALGGRGRIFVADSPLQGGDFARYRAQSGLDHLERWYAAFSAPVRFIDLRLNWAEIDDSSNFIKRNHRLAGDPNGYRIVDLGARSRIAPLVDGRSRFGVSDYEANRTNEHHNDSRHEYCISGTVLGADVIVNLPKMKTHIKTGMTGAMKNLIGTNCSKDYLPHYRLGSPRWGGDEYPPGNPFNSVAGRLRPLLQKYAPLSVWKALRALFMDRPRDAPAVPTLIQSGAWHGNDTLWRTVHDVLDVVRNCAPDGSRREKPRPILTLMDGIVAGEGHGPLSPRPKCVGLLVWGEDPGAIDAVVATLMGFEWRRIPMLANLTGAEARAITHFDGNLDFLTADHTLREFVLTGAGEFAAPTGWTGRIERQPEYAGR